jgi:hypothetical protein
MVASGVSAGAMRVLGLPLICTVLDIIGDFLHFCFDVNEDQAIGRR